MEIWRFWLQKWNPNHVNNFLDDIFSKYKIAKKLREALIKEYATEDANIKKYAIEHFLASQMEKGKSVIAVYSQKIIHEAQSKGMGLPE